ncbi:uncharacterized protein LOC111643709, partial [Copidosoma floridanum]|uniref:uncharacterized protein LOC111643709 n=1 Tax=Copidosoma floridanum TaxID=29053 RepID=UPI000C6F6AB8
MRPDIRQVILGCPSCQTKKLVRVKTKQALLITDTPSRPFEKISIDYYGPIMKRAIAEETVRAITDKFIAYFGPPEHLLSDRGTHFMNKSMDELAKLFKIDKMGSTAFHPQTNGAIERMHHTLTEYIKAYVEKEDQWDEHLPLCMHSYNTTDHESTGGEATPIGKQPGKVELFEKNPGILVENLGQAQSVASTWKIIWYVDWDQRIRETDAFARASNQVEWKCRVTISKEDACRNRIRMATHKTIKALQGVETAYRAVVGQEVRSQVETVQVLQGQISESNKDKIRELTELNLTGTTDITKYLKEQIRVSAFGDHEQTMQIIKNYEDKAGDVKEEGLKIFTDW